MGRESKQAAGLTAKRKRYERAKARGESAWKAL